MDPFPSRYDSHCYNPFINNFCDELGLVDIWRLFHPHTKQFSWFNSSINSYKFRITTGLFLLVWLNQFLNASASPISDQSSIYLLLIPHCHKESTFKSYWKFSCNFCVHIKNLIKEVCTEHNLLSAINKWEFLKYQIQNLAIKFGKEIAKKRNIMQTDIIMKINHLCNTIDLNSEDNYKLMTLQSQLDELYKEKAIGAFIRSRAKWIEKGENNSSYLFN